LRDPGAWTVHFIGCKNVTVSNIKILGDWALSNTDGIDPDMSQNVTIEDCFVYSGDDAIVVKTTGALGVKGSSQDIVAKRCVLMTKKTSLKIGTESRYDIRNILYEDIDIVDSSRGCALWMRDGATYANITFRDIRMPNLMRFPNEQWSGEAYRVSIQERHRRGRMENILFERIRARSEQRSILFSKLDYPVEGLTFKDCVWWAKEDESIPHIEANNAKSIKLINCKIETAGNVEAFPTSLLTGSSKAFINLE
jgi:polygalacturonase